ncbi:nucleotidyltransferase domain-containing protein [Methanosarcina sp. Mfa9]|uniref:nucleotidyltransferase domain-containing protein n=1 Tax=Methanosarcina sp. Mfa9 TaxID=3439063 RepID=UPI003F82D971
MGEIEPFFSYFDFLIPWMNTKITNTIVHINEHMFGIMNICSRPSFSILIFLGRRYHEGFYVRELARALKLGTGTVSEALRELCEAGLLNREERGKIVIYRAEMKSPLLRELKVCFNLMELNPLMLRLRESGAVSRMVLFGSCANGEDTWESDIDLLIETGKKREVSVLIESAQEGLEREFSPIILSPEEFMVLKKKDRPLYERIMNGKVLFEENIGVYDEIPV